MQPRHHRSGSSAGQSLRILIAIGVGAILFVRTAVLVAPALQINKATVQIENGAALGNELLNNIRVYSEGDWHNILNLATGTAHTYYLITSSSPFVATSGIESIQVATTTFTRSFYLSDVYRDGNGYVTSTAAGNTYDPSAKQVVVVYNCTRGAMVYTDQSHNCPFAILQPVRHTSILSVRSRMSRAKTSNSRSSNVT